MKSTLNFMCEDSHGFGEDSRSFGEDLRGFLARERPAIEGALRERLPFSSLKGARRLN
ncbi:MAG TPA: hypothetical protein VJ866_04575 [Pyrinomonadaceae bacterium]|nr:hypothetical protein [Pyrinomonadaceae bacterium]